MGDKDGGDLSEFEARLDFIVNSRTAGVTQIYPASNFNLFIDLKKENLIWGLEF